MARAKKAKPEEVNPDAVTPSESVTAKATPAPKKRGRPKGSSNKTKAAPAKKGRPGRPKGSKNKPKPAEGGKRRGRPKGLGSDASEGSLRDIVVKIVREEVQSALYDAFKNL